jgi:signal transduction histidine kinase
MRGKALPILLAANGFRPRTIEDVEGGFGLMGMHERATAVGGGPRVGNRPEGGYQVVATLPAPVEGGVAG